LWTARLGGWLGTLDQCSSCGRVLQSEAAFHSAGHAEIYCADCRGDWAKSISKEALEVGSTALSGTLDRLLKANPAIDPAKEILSYALDVLEMHIEKKLISRKTFETGESGLIEI
jgi:recombinational DNA repair protein (RecF pathway)